MKPTIYVDTCHIGNIGGGENYLMRFCSVLTKYADVSIGQNFHLQDFLKYNGFVSVFKEFDWNTQPDIHLQCNFNFLTKPIGKKNVVLTFFPKENIDGSVYLPSIDSVLTICDYSAKYVEEYWGFKPAILYPAIDEKLYKNDVVKSNQIISIGHFFQEADGHSKNQHILLEAFRKLDLPDWKLVLIGNCNSEDDAKYLNNMFADTLDINVEFHVNAESSLVKDELAKSKILWHANGFGRSNPAQTEHFGIIVLEAMASNCIPIVHNSGGAKDINGLTFDTIENLVDETKNIIDNIVVPPLYILERQYTLQGFEEGVESWINSLL